MICDSKQVLLKARRWNYLRHSTIVVSQLLYIALTAEILIPGARSNITFVPFLVAVCLIECLSIISIVRRKSKSTASACISIIVWCVLLVWETFSTKLALSNPVLFPTPEAVFNVFPTQWLTLLENTVASLSLLGMGALTAIVAAVIFGAICGWVKPLQSVFAPIARVLAPIPSVVFAPYIILLTPTFRIASATIVFLGLFWPTFLNVIISVQGIDKRILESARMLGLSGFAMVKDVILPYLLPGVINGLNAQLTAAITMLTFAEMLGAKSGLGYYIINYTNFANYVNVIAGIMTVALVVTVLNMLINQLKYHAVKWK